MNLFGSRRDLSISINAATRVVTITDGCTSYKSANITGFLDFTSILNPVSVKTTDSIQISIKDSSQNSVATISSGILYTATYGSIDTMQIDSDNSIVSTVTGLKVKFLPKHDLPVASVLKIQIPSDFKVSEKSTSACTLESLIVLSNLLN